MVNIPLKIIKNHQLDGKHPIKIIKNHQLDGKHPMFSHTNWRGFEPSRPGFLQKFAWKNSPVASGFGTT